MHTHRMKNQGSRLFPPVLYSVLLLHHTPYDPLKEQDKQCYSLTAVSQHLCALPEVGVSMLQVGQKDSPCRRSHRGKNNPNGLLGSARALDKNLQVHPDDSLRRKAL